jgi:hypothetical protein
MSLLAQLKQWQYAPQDSPLAKHSQYFLRHSERLQVHFHFLPCDCSPKKLLMMILKLLNVTNLILKNYMIF